MCRMEESKDFLVPDEFANSIGIVLKVENVCYKDVANTDLNDPCTCK